MAFKRGIIRSSLHANLGSSANEDLRYPPSNSRGIIFTSATPMSGISKRLLHFQTWPDSRMPLCWVEPVSIALSPVSLPTLALSAVLWLAGCTHALLNKPLIRYEPTSGFRYAPRIAGVGTSDVAILLFFSGGGKRAAALSYGVLSELAATTAPISGRDQRLLDQVEVISSVSGGSFTAAYYCLYHDRIFTDFEPRFLKHNVN